LTKIRNYIDSYKHNVERDHGGAINLRTFKFKTKEHRKLLINVRDVDFKNCTCFEYKSRQKIIKNKEFLSQDERYHEPVDITQYY